MKKNVMTSERQCLNGKDFEEFHESVKRWKSDLDFFRDDLQFLSHLMGNYFVWLIEKNNVDDIRVLNDTLNELKRKCQKLLKQIDEHNGQLAQNLKYAIEDNKHLRKEHKGLGMEVSRFAKEFREVKRDVFVIAEHAIDVKRIQFLA